MKDFLRGLWWLLASVPCPACECGLGMIWCDACGGEGFVSRREARTIRAAVGLKGVKA